MHEKWWGLFKRGGGERRRSLLGFHCELVTVMMRIHYNLEALHR